MIYHELQWYIMVYDYIYTDIQYVVIHDIQRYIMMYIYIYVLYMIHATTYIYIYDIDTRLQ